MIRALRYSPGDDVAVVLEETRPADLVLVDGESESVTAREQIPPGHKIAIKQISTGETVTKSGTSIAAATRDIPVGSWVHCHNVKSLIERWDPDRQLYWEASSIKEIDDSFLLKEKPSLYGYRRKNGQVGFRNHLLVISTVLCANQLVQDAGYRYREIAAVTNPTGCLMIGPETERMKTILLSMAGNPNVGAVIFVGLGCETIDAEWFSGQIGDDKPCAFVRIQDEGSTWEAEKKLDGFICDMLSRLYGMDRVPVSVADIRLGTKCGASDWTTTVVSNPVIGMISDRVVKNGGISLLGETMGWFGGEDMLLRKARTKEIAQKTLDLMSSVYRRAAAVGKQIDEGNPTPGNKAGGITTLNEKALGNVKKGGTAPIDGVLAFGEIPDKAGFYVTDNPGLDPISLLGMTASSANVILFSTGRGTPTGTPLAPTIKLTGSPEAYASFGAHMDVDLSPVVGGQMTLPDAEKKLWDRLIEVCNGDLTIAEKCGNREFAFPLAMGPL